MGDEVAGVSHDVFPADADIPGERANRVEVKTEFVGKMPGRKTGEGASRAGWARHRRQYRGCRCHTT